MDSTNYRCDYNEIKNSTKEAGACDDEGRKNEDDNLEKDDDMDCVLKTNQNIEDSIKEYGQGIVNSNDKEYNIYLLSIIGEIEGHECLPQTSKTTKYEHILPELAVIQDNKKVDGVLLLLNTVSEDVERGLAIAEMVASLSKTTVYLVLGGSHTIEIKLAV